MDPYEWRESVLSTRSLSHISNAASYSSPLHHAGASSRQSSVTYLGSPSHKNSEYGDSDDLEMADAQEREDAVLHDIPELPESVAHSLLFELPREIRDRIYSLCLASKDSAPVEWPRPRDSVGEYDLQPQLLRTCRIVHDEAAPLLYTLNNMTFHHPSDANMFVHAFASSTFGRHISNLSLHIKAQDSRLWMPYLTSTDESRSLKADFPNLKELGVRFRSNKWQHQNSPTANLKTWCEDGRLLEVMNGLRDVFLPGTPPDRTENNERVFQSYMARNPSALQQDIDNTQSRWMMKELRKAKAKFQLASRQDAPVIRVCCACRVHTTHFNALTTPTPAPQSANDEHAPPPHAPVQEGEPFGGFTAIDLQTGVKRLHDPDLGSANVVRTVYAVKNGILLALEIHCLDPRKDAAERAA